MEKKLTFHFGSEEATIIRNALSEMPYIDVCHIIDYMNNVVLEYLSGKTQPPKTKAPHGLKKDGTPAKKRGRKPA